MDETQDYSERFSDGVSLGMNLALNNPNSCKRDLIKSYIYLVLLRVDPDHGHF